MEYVPNQRETIGSVQRRYVLKRAGFDPRGEEILRFLREQIGCQTVRSVRTAVRYDVEGLDDDAFRQAAERIYAEAPVDELCDEAAFLHRTAGMTAFGIEALPGQYDQRADCAEQSVQVMMESERPTTRVATFLLLEGTITPEHLQRLKDSLINPTDSREASRARPRSLQEPLPDPPDVRTIDGFRSFPDERLENFRRELGLAMTVADLQSIRAHFQEKQRDPTLTELKVLDTYWSDHCRHTTFTTELTEIALAGQTIVHDGQWVVDGAIAAPPVHRAVADALRLFLHDRETLYSAQGAADRPLSLMDLALFSMREAKARGLLPDLEESEENNAASIVVPVHFEDGHREEWLFLFKNETHNHPTEIEPFGGAATCLGGVIRDPLSGRGYVTFAIRVSGSGDPRVPLERTLPGKLPQRLITTKAAAGFSAYGNQIGVPSLKVQECIHEGFVGKRFEAGFVGGAIRRAYVRREQPEPGDVILLVGGKTGRDGIGGASGSSKVHDETSTVRCGAEVQKGNPVEERKLQRLLTQPEVSRMIKRCNDFGAGGVAVAVGELADGISINLDAVPLKYRGLDGTEIAISESQERMAVVIAPADAQEFIQRAEEENLEATPIATVINTGTMVMDWRGKSICRLDRSLLTGGWAKRTAVADLRMPTDVRAFFDRLPPGLDALPLEEQWTENLRRLAVCSQRGLQEGFDSTVGAHTVVSPFGGTHQLSPSEAVVAAFPAEGARTAIVASAGYDPNLAQESPFHGALYAVVDSLARIVASGASWKDARLTLQNYFERLDGDPVRWGKPLLAQLGARVAQRNLAPAIGGKDSMSGSYLDKTTGLRLDVPPTIVSFAVAPIDRTRVTPSCFQRAGSSVVYLPVPLDGAAIPQWNHLRKMWQAVHARAQEGSVLSSHAVHAGGVAAAITEMALGNGIGARIRTSTLSTADWFAPRYGSMIVELSPETDPAAIFAGTAHTVLGMTVSTHDITLEAVPCRTLPLATLQSAWEEPFESVFPSVPQDRGDGRVIDWPSHTVRHVRVADLAPVSRPRAAILTFPGTNCEVETAAAFERAGASVTVPVFVNLTRERIHVSIERFASLIDQSQILAFPGGFSAGDEPDGSGKFIATILHSPRISDAIEGFLKKGGLILGICNGFQALIKSRLLLTGRTGPLGEADPTLTHNTIGRYLSRHALHRVLSVRSPWMEHFDVGEQVAFPIAHGEGRLIHLPEDTWENGQVPFQYIGRDGTARMQFPDNPNGSEDCAAALTDSSGQIFGMMAHPERAMPGLSVNIPGDRRGLDIFRGGVDYFTS